MTFKLNSPWVMSVPVISTAHMPDKNAIFALSTPYMTCDDGGMVWVSDDLSDIEQPWLHEIARKLHVADGWVRLDSDGPVIEGLTTYEW